MKQILAILLLSCGYHFAAAQASSEHSPVLVTAMAGATTKVSDVIINPNPVKGQQLSLELQNVEKGKYTIYACNSEGIKIILKTVTIDTNGNTIHSIDLPKEITSGTYILQVLSKTSRYCKKMVVE